MVMFPQKPSSANGFVQPPLITRQTLSINSLLTREIPLEKVQSLIGSLLHRGRSTPSVQLSPFLSAIPPPHPPAPSFFPFPDCVHHTAIFLVQVTAECHWIPCGQEACRREWVLLQGYLSRSLYHMDRVGRSPNHILSKSLFHILLAIV